MLIKTTRLSLVDQVTQQLESLIESGKWPVGKKIPAEPELVEELQVSRNTLREAIKALSHAGLLKTKQGDGTYVCSNSTLGVALQRRVQRSNLLETLEVRNALEQEAARLSAERRTEQDLERIKLYLSECDSFAVAHDMENYVSYDIKLHQAIVESTGNKMLNDLYGHITEALRESVATFVEERFCQDYHQNIHHQLVEAIAEQNGKKAAIAVQQYIDELKRELEMEEM